MKINIFTPLLITIFIAISFSPASLNAQTVVQWYTSMGDFNAQLREDLVPNTAQNFIDLTNDNFYDDLIFHRVIIDFMIQDGCPMGNGSGGPGYTFDDEFHPDLRHDEPGILSMANSGPNTNGSQYFITVVPTDWLDDLHAVFGKIMDGLDVVYAISEVATDSIDRPYVDVVIDSIRVVTGDPVLTLSGPLDGTKWNGAVDNEITWDSEFVADVKIELSTDNGATWMDIEESTSANTRTYTWEASNMVSAECLVKISDVANPDIYDVNEAPFTLSELNLLNPSGFGFYRVGSPVEVEWTYDMVGDLTLLYKTAPENEWEIIEENVSVSSMMYEWIPDVATDWCQFMIRESAYPDVLDVTDSYFLVFQLDMTSPLGGETLTGNSLFDIGWESEIITSIKIEFSSDGGENWSTVVGSTQAASSSYEWSVPNISSSDCFIKLFVPSLPDLYSMNETPFVIDEYLDVAESDLDNDIKFSLYPNPADQLLYLTLHQDVERVEVYNIHGNQVYYFDNPEKSHVIDISGLSPGLYIANVTTGGAKESLRFLKK